MLIYLLIFFTLVGIYLLTARHGGCNNKLFFIIMMAVALFVGLSDMLGGYDRYIYSEFFDQVADVGKTATPDYLKECGIFRQWPGEKGFGWLNVLISFLTSNRYIFILILTVIIYVLLYISIRQYAKNNILALIVFMGILFFFTFTYLRQMLGISIAWLGIRYIYDRSFWKFALIILIAFSMHNSALILFPVYFIPHKKMTINSVLFILGICLLLGIFGISSFLYDSYGDTFDSERAATLSISEENFRFGYLVEAVFFVYIILQNYDFIPDTKKDIVLLNVSLLFCAILLLFVRSENGGRMSWYYAIGVVATLSNIAVYKGRIENGLLIRTAVFTGYHAFLLLLSFYLYFRILKGWGEGGLQLLYPYKTFLTNGHRENDQIFENYEYDFKYDKDKFYR
ncbi:EpsG family protein [Segatella maculosa]|uniref:EpsG family protein n=1 Tax=Segatella maculosa TaxID=439703 RepID=UPI0023F1C7F5|nr:EpsG family protein [Segatella maculosa]